MLGESFAVLAVGFATLAVPLALSARSTACTFALEGAALVWLGFRQQRRLPRWSGLALQALAAGAFLFRSRSTRGAADTIAIANGGCISAVLIAGAAFASAWLYARNGANAQFATVALPVGSRLVDRRRPARDRPLRAARMQSAGAARVRGARPPASPALRWRCDARRRLAWTAAVALALGVVLVFAFAAAGARPFAGWGLAAFAAYAVIGFLTLRELRDSTRRPLRDRAPRLDVDLDARARPRAAPARRRLRRWRTAGATR